VYICGGRIHYINLDGKLMAREHLAAAPLMWVAAHDVRPARQALGTRRCEDCHDVASPFFFGKVVVDTPMVSGQGEFRRMSDFQGIDVQRVKVFGWSFVFRPWLKAIGLTSCVVLAILALAFTGRVLFWISRAFSERDGD
jgi:hypothetical protein